MVTTIADPCIHFIVFPKGIACLLNGVVVTVLRRREGDADGILRKATRIRRFHPRMTQHDIEFVLVTSVLFGL